MKRDSIKQIILLILTLLVVFGGLFYFLNQPVQMERVTPLSGDSEEVLSISLSIEGLYEAGSVVIEANETVLEMLERLDEENAKIKLSTKDFGELGVLVEAMGGRVNGTDNRYWQYTVNDVAPMVGADSYQLQNGDTVMWEFKASEY